MTAQQLAAFTLAAASMVRQNDLERLVADYHRADLLAA